MGMGLNYNQTLLQEPEQFQPEPSLPEPEQFQPEPTTPEPEQFNRNQLQRQQDASLDTANVSNILCNVPKCLQKSSKAKCCNFIKIF